MFFGAVGFVIEIHTGVVIKLSLKVHDDEDGRLALRYYPKDQVIMDDRFTQLLERIALETGIDHALSLMAPRCELLFRLPPAFIAKVLM